MPELSVDKGLIKRDMVRVNAQHISTDVARRAGPLQYMKITLIHVHSAYFTDTIVRCS